MPTTLNEFRYRMKDWELKIQVGEVVPLYFFNRSTLQATIVAYAVQPGVVEHIEPSRLQIFSSETFSKSVSGVAATLCYWDCILIRSANGSARFALISPKYYASIMEPERADFPRII